MNLQRGTAVAVAVGLVVAALAACTPKSQPVVLTIGTNEVSTTSVAVEIRHLAALVDKASGGSIKLRPHWRVGGDSTTHWDQGVAQQVMSGDLDAGMIPSRAWDALGVTTLRALNAPFVVTTDQAMIGATAGAIETPMLAGLQKAGVHGLDLFPESLRHPNGFAAPLRGKADYQGVAIRVPYSRTTTAMFEAFGARPVDDAPDPDTQAAMETSYTRAVGPVVTANVTYFAKYDAFVINAKRWRGMDENQRRLLDTASKSTQAWVIDHLPTDRELAAKFCARGGIIAIATDADVAELRAAAQPVVTSLRTDPFTAKQIDRLISLAPAHADPVPSCADTTKPTAKIDGTYEFTTTTEQLKAGGVTDQFQLIEEAATFRFRFSGSSWRYDAHADHTLSQPSRSGTFSLNGDRLTIYWSGQPQDNTSADVEVLSDGSLHFTDVVDADPAFEKMSMVKFGDHPWRRVG